jgi:hypothetical protein
MEALIQVLLTLIGKVPWLSEAERDGIIEKVRGLEGALGLSGVVPPAAVDPNQPAPVPDVAVPGPVAEPVPPDQQPPPPTGLVGAATGENEVQPETTNAFIQAPPPDAPSA